MKKSLFAFCMIVLLLITGCANTDGTASERERMIEQMDPAKDRHPNQDDLHDQLGFVRYKKEDMNDREEINHTVTIDKTKMANMITRVILQNDGFNEVATLVTDKEVLIAYEINNDFERDVAADIAKRSAESIMPRFFDVYVTDQETLINDIQSLHNSRLSNKNYQNTVDKIIEQMKRSPQGL